MSTFTNELVVKSFGNKWELMESFYFYYLDKNHDRTIIVIPSGFITDFASTPRILYPIFPPIGKYNKATLVHDFLYSKKSNRYNLTRKQSDKFFLQSMEVLGIGKKRYLMYYAVRLFGKSNYKKK
jgi:hypothetical protein